VATVLGPFVSIVSGALATWLIGHFPGLHLPQSTLAATIADTVAFAIGAGGTFVLQHKWLSGWQQWEKGLTDQGSASRSRLGPSAPDLERPDVDPIPDQADPIHEAQILPNALQELASIPDGNGPAAVSIRPETAVIPDVPSDEAAPAVV
jgi:hypothetical protein